MDAKDLKKYLAGLGIAGLLAGGGAIAADQPAAKAEDKTKSAVRFRCRYTSFVLHRMTSKWLRGLWKAESAVSVQAFLTAAVAVLMVIATAAMITATITHTRIVDELAEEALRSVAFALAASAEGILADKGDTGVEN